MIERLLPKSIDQGYHGHALAKWVLAVLTVITLVRSLIHIFFPDGGAQSIATIPLSTFTSAGGSAVVTIFALWGLSQLLLGFVYLAVLVRYQALIPFIYLLFIAEYLGRALIGFAKPLLTIDTPPGATANMVFPILGVVMFALSLRSPRSEESES
ncbi:hypothetical protein MK489_02695 [Myxococcota bacterium]|nr:hypothetical protein [Myxococcota bacterium]